MSLELDIGFDSQPGPRPVNEDFAGLQLPGASEAAHGVIAAIADGGSSGGFGGEAAQTTVTSVVRDYYGTPATWDTTVALERIISAQNAWLTGLNRSRAPGAGMTTLTVLVLRGHGWSLAHVGDTRAYLLRAGRLTQLTHDHAVAQHDFRHQLTRAVGADPRLVVDCMQGDLLVGDLFVLLSDGVHGALSDRHLAALLHGSAAATRGVQGAQAFSQALTQAALQAGSPDNATALVVQVRGLQQATLADARRRTAELPALARLAPGEAVDGLLVDAVLADNGVYAVYKVHSDSVNSRAGLRPKEAESGAPVRYYALKALLPRRGHDAEERAALAHEAWLAQRLATSAAAPHLVALHPAPPAAHGPSACYLLYDWHAGETLQQLLARGGALSVPQVLQVAGQAARALAGLHRQGVIHRDVTPAKLHQGADGVLRLLDLGVALSGHEPPAMRQLHAGTPSYINPEQWGYRFEGGGRPNRSGDEPEPPDAMSDLFALGVTLYQLLTRGKLPYGEVLPYQAGRYRRDPLRPSRHNPEVPTWLDHIALKAVARDKRQRFETAEELLLALERGAARPLSAPAATPLLQRDPTVPWKLLLGVSALLNLLLLVWLLFLPR